MIPLVFSFIFPPHLCDTANLTAELSGGADWWLVYDLSNSLLKIERNC
jgi:hypothetical protein